VAVSQGLWTHGSQCHQCLWDVRQARSHRRCSARARGLSPLVSRGHVLQVLKQFLLPCLQPRVKHSQQSPYCTMDGKPTLFSNRQRPKAAASAAQFADQTRVGSAYIAVQQRIKSSKQPCQYGRHILKATTVPYIVHVNLAT
jgi:hypothetical protein